MNIKRYTLPVIVAAGLHGALFMSSIMTSKGTAYAAPMVKPKEPIGIPIDDSIVHVPEETSHAAEDIAPVARHGEVLPELPELPDVTATNSEFFKPEIERAEIKVDVTHITHIAERGIHGGTGEWDRGGSVPKIFSSAELDRAPIARVQTAPRYPTTMSHHGITGSVVVEFDVNTEGTVVRATALRYTHSEFVEPALRAVRSWKFSRGMREGRPVAFRMRVPIEFGLDL